MRLKNFLVAAFLASNLTTRAEEIPGTPALFSRLDVDQDGQLTSTEVAVDHQRLFTRLLRTGDKNDDGQLSAQEFAAALTPSRPEKPLEQTQDSENPGAKATKWLLLTLDTNGDMRLMENEIPEDYLRVFDRLVEQIDRDEDGILNRGEINRGGPQITRQAIQTARQMQVDVERELAKFTKQQGERVNRFDEAPDPRQALSDPSNANELFARLDSNGDGHLKLNELPDPVRDRLARPFRNADANRDGKLTSEEFKALSRRLAAFAGNTQRQRDSQKNSTPPIRQKPIAE